MTTLTLTASSSPLRTFAAELARRQPRLARIGLACMVAVLPLLIAAGLDPRLVNGISIWVKPIKFLVSLCLYFWTFAWVFGYLSPSAQRTRLGRYILGVTPVIAAFEMTWLIGMALLGQPAHFNRSSPWAGALYTAAGIGAVGLTIGILLQGILVARDRGIALAPAFRVALVLGAVLAFAGTLFFGATLGGKTGHWVGGVMSDAGGLPLLYWSTTGGDLRVPHFWATHASQLVPLAGLWVARRGGRFGIPGVLLVGVAYAGFVVATYLQARAGHPFIAW